MKFDKNNKQSSSVNPAGSSSSEENKVQSDVADIKQSVTVPDKSEKNYIVDGVEYYALKQEQFLPDRVQYIEDQWNSSFPTKKGYKYEKITQLVGRSPIIASWYSSVMLKFRDCVGLPVHVQDLLSADQFKKCQTVIKELNERSAKLSKAKQLAAEEYKQRLDAIDKEYKDIQDKKDSDDFLFILTLTSNDLPLGVIDRIADYVPKDVTSPVTKRIFAREQVIRYQRELIMSKLAGENVREKVAKDQQDFDYPV